MTELTVEDWTSRGYKRYEVSDQSREVNKLADFLLQKRFDDEKGKKYFITVYCYDRKRYPDYMKGYLPEIGFMPTSNMNLGEKRPFFNIEMNAIESVAQVESFYEMFWQVLGRPYYEEFENE